MGSAKPFSAYRQLFSLPRFGPSLVAAVAGKLQPGVFSLALLLEVAHYRSFGKAAMVVSLSALAGVTVPVRGRLMDRYGYTPVMVPALVLYLAGIAGLVANERAHGAFEVTVACAMLAGVSAPPIQIVTRLMWRSMATGDLRTTALSLDAVLADVGFIVGPTAAAVLASTVAPWAGLAASATMSTVATCLLLSRRLPHERKAAGGERHILGPLRSAPLRHTMVAAVLFFLAVRAAELAFPAWAQQHRTPLMSGVLLSCMAVGSVTGGAVLGALPVQWAERAKLPTTLAVLSTGTLAAAAASRGWEIVFAVAVALMGIALGPTFVALYATAADLAPEGTAAETQSWIGSFMSLGGAAGTAVSGEIAVTTGPGAVLLLAAVSMALAAVLAYHAVTRAELATA